MYSLTQRNYNYAKENAIRTSHGSFSITIALIGGSVFVLMVNVISIHLMEKLEYREVTQSIVKIRKQVILEPRASNLLV